MPSRVPQQRHIVLLFLSLALMLAAGMGLRDPWPADEPRFALAAKHMVESGDFLIPRRGIEYYADKPPMFMWLQAAGYYLTGHWRIAFLLPSLLASLATLYLVFDLATRIASRRAALLASAACAICFQFSFQSKGAQIDPTVVFLITLGCYGFLRHMLLGPAWSWYFLGWAAAGLGIITKGVGVLVLLMLLPYLYARYRGYRGLADIPARHAAWWLGPFFMLAAMAVWLVPLGLAVLSDPNPAVKTYAQDILFKQTSERYANAWHHLKPWWYFLQVVLLAWLPSIALAPWALPAWLRRLRRKNAAIALPLAWAALVFVFFSLSPGKRDMYILPALPMLCVALAPLLPGLLRRRDVQWTLGVLLIAIAGAFLLLGAMAICGNPGYERNLESLPESIWWMPLTIGAIGLIFATIWRKKCFHLAWYWFAFTLWSLWGWWGYPALNDSRSAQEVMRQTEVLLGPKTELGMVAWKEQNYLQAMRPVQDFGFTKPWPAQRATAVAWLAENPGGRKVLILEQAMEPCIDQDKAQLVGMANRRSWWLFGWEAVRANCIKMPSS